MSIKQQKGITLWEVLVTIVITTIGLLGLSALQVQSVRSAEDSGNRSHAIWMANDLINRMRANEVEDYSFNGTMNCTAFPEDLTVCGAYHNGGQQVAPAVCDNTEQATFDRWEVLCGMPADINGNTNVMRGSASFITNPGLQIITLANGDVQMTIDWDSRTSGVDADGTQRFMIDESTASTVQRESFVTVFRP